MTSFGSDIGLVDVSQGMTSNATTPYAFDPQSLLILNGISSKHKSHQRASEVIQAGANTISTATENGRTAVRHGLTYDQFLAGLLYPEETMLVGQFVHYDQVVFYAESTSPPKTQMTRGRAFLTNHRLLLLSAEDHQGLSLTALAPGTDRKPTGYAITGTASDVLHFQSIPLASLKSVELRVAVGVSTSGAVFGNRPCCLLSALSCFGMDACLKSWSSINLPVVHATNERVLTMGVTMPPWDHGYMMQLHLNGGVPLTLVKDYVVALHRFAPALKTNAQKSL